MEKILVLGLGFSVGDATIVACFRLLAKFA